MGKRLRKECATKLDLSIVVCFIAPKQWVPCVRRVPSILMDLSSHILRRNEGRKTAGIKCRGNRKRRPCLRHGAAFRGIAKNGPRMPKSLNPVRLKLPRCLARTTSYLTAT